MNPLTRSGLFARLIATCIWLGSPVLAAPPIAPDPAGDVFPIITDNDPAGAAGPVMAADQAAAGMRVPGGFGVDVFAAEPAVQNPIAMAWDAAGRLWVAENYTYSDSRQRFDRDLRDRVVILDDADGDGVHDSRRVFLDSVQMLTSVEVGDRGVWLMCPPQLLFVPDADHDGTADGPAEVVLDGFDVAQQNYHNFANGLRFGPDGWLYGRCGGSCPGKIGKPDAAPQSRVAIEGGLWRYHPVTTRFEVLTSGTTNPWGHDWNDDGELFFVNTVNGHLWHAIAGAHFVRPFTLDPNRHTYELIDFHADHWHFDTRGTWQESRDGAADDFGGGHAHCGAMIYQGGHWPERYHGKLFTLNFHGRRCNVENLVPAGSGYIARHDDDFAPAADPWFRGMELMYGPDGNVYVADWSDTGECHEHTGVHRQSGRIFKISYDRDTTAAPFRSLYQLSDIELVKRLVPGDLRDTSRHNEWFTRQARLVLTSRHREGRLSVDAIDLLNTLIRSTPQDAPKTRLRLLQTLHCVGGVDDATLAWALATGDVSQRCWALRVIVDDWPIDDTYGPWLASWNEADRVDRQSDVWMEELLRLAADDPSPRVRLMLASTLQRLPSEKRWRLAEVLLRHAEDAHDHNLPLMIWYGLMATFDSQDPRYALPAGWTTAVRDARLSPVTRLIARRVAEDLSRDPSRLSALLAAVTDPAAIGDAATLSRDVAILEGITTAVAGVRRVPRPDSWSAFATRLSQAGYEQPINAIEVVFGDGLAIDRLRDIAADADADADARLAALESLIQSRDAEVFAICGTLLGDPRINVAAARGLAAIDGPRVGPLLVSHYGRFRGPDRPTIVSLLVSRRSYAAALIQAIRSGAIPRQDVSAYQVRQIHSFDDPELSRQISDVWGEVRGTSSQRQDRIIRWKAELTDDVLAQADLSRGRGLFDTHCQNCHRLYGSGGVVGPELTGSNRNNLDYLLSNVIDPGAIVDKDYRMSIVLLTDGRIISGLVVDRGEQSWRIQTATELVVVDTQDIEEEKVTDQSPMPEGILEAMTAQQRRDLIAYLKHPTQVAPPLTP